MSGSKAYNRPLVSRRTHPLSAPGMTRHARSTVPAEKPVGERGGGLLLLGAYRLSFGAVGAGALFAFTGACLV